ncbi:hypothetical protein [Flaviaesturariibacter amylovorans]|uniref:hypothetical protein n=1 Tax=Flaviaesturariibacter amylovorans TaxID=1084520 RepID=UPI0031E81975
MKRCKQSSALIVSNPFYRRSFSPVFASQALTAVKKYSATSVFPVHYSLFLVCPMPGATSRLLRPKRADIRDHTPAIEKAPTIPSGLFNYFA